MKKTTYEFYTTDFGPLVLAGKKTTVRQGDTAESFVAACREDGTIERLLSLPGRVSPDGDIAVRMGEYDAATRSFTEIPGVFVSPGSDIGDADTRVLPECTMGILRVTGATRDLARGAHNKLVKLMKAAGFEPDYSYGYSMEYYSREKYENDGDEYEFCYYLLCRKV